MITDPLFYLVAIPAVLITGVSKGGFGGVALLSVPLLSLVISPVQAAGIMLPILVAMDVMTVAVYRRSWDKRNLMILLPGALIGVIVGTLTARWVDDQWIRFIVGTIAIVFAADYWLRQNRRAPSIKPASRAGAFWGGLAGYTSFIAHAGAPPFQVYMLPQRLDRIVYSGTSVMFFAVVNVMKIPPYGFLGLLAPANLTTSLLLLPAAPIGVAMGVWINRRMSNFNFYQVIYAVVLLVGVKLIWDALTA